MSKTHQGGSAPTFEEAFAAFREAAKLPPAEYKVTVAPKLGYTPVMQAVPVPAGWGAAVVSATVQAFCTREDCVVVEWKLTLNPRWEVCVDLGYLALNHETGAWNWFLKVEV